MPEPGNPIINMDMSLLSVQPSNVMVNGFGERFCNEAIGLDFSMHSHAVKRQLRSWSIFAQNLRKYYMEKSVDGGIGVIKEATTRITNFDELWNNAAKTDKTTMAKGSLKEIATVMNVPYDTLKKP
jgi:hypothetical protein